MRRSPRHARILPPEPTAQKPVLRSKRKRRTTEKNVKKPKLANTSSTTSPSSSSGETSSKIQDEEVTSTETMSFFNKGPNGELLDGNADTYRAMGFGWVGADHPTRAAWAAFTARGVDCSRVPDMMDIIEKYWPDWRTAEHRPRSRSCSRSPSPLPDRPSTPSTSQPTNHTTTSVDRPEEGEGEHPPTLDTHPDDSYDYYPY